MKRMKILITGGAGFIGSNFVEYILKNHPKHEIINYDKLTYAGNPKNVEEFEEYPNYKFIKGDICNFNKVDKLVSKVDAIIHIAAESHVDNSYGNSLRFTLSNTYGTHTLLEIARKNNIKKFLHVSTDEIYGEIEKGSFKEDNILKPTNPYSASKAAAEMFIQAYLKTYNMPIIIVRANNTFGPKQYPEKLISGFIHRLIQDKKVPLHGNGSHKRTYIYVEDVCRGIYTAFEKGKNGEFYNLGTNNEFSNMEITEILLKKFNKSKDYIQFNDDRPFNDKRYSIDSSKLRKLGWSPKTSFEEGLNLTIKWYKNHLDWFK